MKFPTFLQLLRKHGVTNNAIDHALGTDSSIYIDNNIVMCRQGVAFLARHKFWDRRITSPVVEKELVYDFDPVSAYCWLAVLYYGRSGVFYDDKLKLALNPETVRRELFYRFPYRVGRTLYTWGAGDMLITGIEKGFILAKYKFVETPTLPYVVRYKIDWKDGKWSLSPFSPFCHVQNAINPSTFDVTGVAE